MKKKANEGDAPKPAKTKAHNEGEKLVIRRLPPGMTQDEFVSILGNAWELGKGRVDWFSFAPGKISTEYATVLRRAVLFADKLFKSFKAVSTRSRLCPCDEERRHYGFKRCCSNCSLGRCQSYFH